MMAACVLPSGVRTAEFYGDKANCCYSDLSVAGWTTTLVHRPYSYTVGQDSKCALKEMFELVGLPCLYVGTLGRGGVHEKYFDPLNGFLEYTGGMAYVYWHWKTVIDWLTYGWPRPSGSADDRGPGSWCWLENEYSRLVPCFDQYQIRELRRIGVKDDVINGDRRMTEDEALNACFRVINAYKMRKD